MSLILFGAGLIIISVSAIVMGGLSGKERRDGCTVIVIGLLACLCGLVEILFKL